MVHFCVPQRHLWILGASDPEMEAEEALVAENVRLHAVVARLAALEEVAKTARAVAPRLSERTIKCIMMLENFNTVLSESQLSFDALADSIARLDAADALLSIK